MHTFSTDESTLPTTITPLLRWRLLLVIRGFAPEEADRLARLRMAVDEGALGGPDDHCAEDRFAQGPAGERGRS